MESSPNPVRPVVTIDGFALEQTHARSTSRKNTSFGLLRFPHMQHHRSHPFLPPHCCLQALLDFPGFGLPMYGSFGHNYGSLRMLSSPNVCPPSLCVSIVLCTCTWPHNIHTDVRISAISFTLVSTIFLSWTTLYLTRMEDVLLVYLLFVHVVCTCSMYFCLPKPPCSGATIPTTIPVTGGRQVLGDELYNALDIGQLDLQGSGLSS